MIPYFQDIAIRVSDYLGTSAAISENLVQTLFVIIGLVALRYLLIALVYRRSSSPAVHYNFKRYSTQIFVILGLLLVGKVWIEGFQSIATFLGLLSVGLALALRELLTGLAGWVYIIVRQPFEMGDRIEVAGVKGDIIDKRMFTFSVIEVGNRVDAEQSTGRIIHIPNSKVFTDTVANYTSGFPFIWHEVAVVLSFGSNVKKARDILSEITNAHAAEFVDEAEAALKHAQESFMLKFTIFTPAVYVSATENGIKLTSRYLCPVRKTRNTEQAIVLDLIERYQAEKDIDYAFRTMRLKADERLGGENK